MNPLSVGILATFWCSCSACWVRCANMQNNIIEGIIKLYCVIKLMLKLFFFKYILKIFNECHYICWSESILSHSCLIWSGKLAQIQNSKRNCQYSNNAQAIKLWNLFYPRLTQKVKMHMALSYLISQSEGANTNEGA